jgi:hypothetical protein
VGGVGSLSLVADDTIEREIDASRLALALDADSLWQFTDLRTRMLSLERRNELAAHDLLRANVVARLWVEAWSAAGLGHAEWLEVQEAIQAEFSQWVGLAYHDTNLWLIQRGVMPEVDLRPFIRRSGGVVGNNSLGTSFLESAHGGGEGRSGHGGQGQAASSGVATLPSDHESTSRAGSPSQPHASTAAAARSSAGRRELNDSPGNLQAQDVMAQLQQVLRRHVPSLAAAKPSLADAAAAQPAREAPMRAEGLVKASPRLQAVIQRAQEALQRPQPAAASASGSGAAASTGALEEVRARSQAFKQALKKAAATPVERATIEIVALLFQSILTEDRIPAAVRVWFARLQMPVLRVAVSEPDFFATVDHPARRLIDRMGACVMGFDATSAREVGDSLEKEIKRVVQVVEAYPDTGRRVFQTVLTEFEKFLEHFFKNENEASRKGVSLAQQVEQRETLGDPVHDRVAQDAQRGAGAGRSERLPVPGLGRRARDDGGQARRRQPRREGDEARRRRPHLVGERQGLARGAGRGDPPPAAAPEDAARRHERGRPRAGKAGRPHPATAEFARRRVHREDGRDLQRAARGADDAARDARGTAARRARRRHRRSRLVLDLSGHESAELEVVGEGGSMPTPAMLTWAKELQVGGWYMLDYRNRNDQVQLAWQGLRKQLTLFVSPHGRGILFQRHRLAAFLQAGLLVPAQDESLTTRATRSALAKLDVDPQRLLN